MSEHKLDQIVKGAPPSNVSAPQVAAAAISRDPSSEHTAAELHESKKPSAYIPPTDPLSTLPSSPPQIYLNLLILEASLRSQYLALHARRRQHIFFLTLLGLWNIYFLYALFLRPREDGKGVGGSPYWVVDMAEKVAFMGGVLTAVLIWGTGQWERGVRWPRRWLGITNRGLRGMNLKVVVIRGPWWKQLLSYASLAFPYSAFYKSQGSNYRVIDFRDKREAANAKANYRDSQFQSTKEEDIAPGGDRVKLLLLPKSFSPDFRENWELYRGEYWEKENERRAELRKRVKRRDRELAKQHGGRWWWVGWRAGKATVPESKDLEKSHLHAHPQHRQVKETRKRRPSNQGSHSRSSSRSSTYSATPEVDDARLADSNARGPRKARSSTRQSTRRAAAKTTRMTPLDASEEHEEERMLSKRASMLSNASSSASDGELSEPSAPSAKRGSSDNAPNLRTRQRDIDSGEVDE